MTSRLQPGIAFQSGRRPQPYYRLLLLDAAAEARGPDVRNGLRSIHGMLHRLANGDVRELAGQPDDKAQESVEQFSGLEHLVAFGRRLFDTSVRAHPMLDAPRPDYLAYLPADGPFPALRWESANASPNRGEADIAIQLTAPNRAAVDAGAVEVWKLLEELGRPLRAVASFDGFGRHDGRGWLGFHDGVSNLHSSHRAAALEASDDPPWMAGGTYMAFLRLVVDLSSWHALARSEQELLVGRDKLSGSAVVGTNVGAAGQRVPVAGTPPGDDADDRAISDYIEPPQTTDRVVEASHVHRASQARGSPPAAAALRMFRQGYEFLEDIHGQPRLGLNFVSFQRDLAIVQHVLHLPGWLGDVNFGGPTHPEKGEPKPLQLLAVAAGGFYAVPPSGSHFPGADIFMA